MKENKSIVIIGPAYPLRGGLASFNERLAKEALQAGHRTIIFTFSLQYPSFLFPGTTQYSSEEAPENIPIDVAINSINPLNWFLVGNKLRRLKPDIIIVRYWLPFMGACLGTILRMLKGNKQTKIICIADNIIPHEKRRFDNALTKYFVKPIDYFLTMSEKVLQDVALFSHKPAKYIPHPLYDDFGEAVSKQVACNFLKLDDSFQYALFFGFIRKYKGLDLLLQAIHELKIRNVEWLAKTRFIIAGEFYEDNAPYLKLIDELNINDHIILKTSFIPNSEIKYYFSASSVVLQPYKSATQSGITPLSFYYEKPTIVTNVGGLPKFVSHKKTGIITEPDVKAIAEGIDLFFTTDIQVYQENIIQEKGKYTWTTLLNTILKLAE